MLGRPNRWITNLLMVTFRVKITVTFRVRSAIVLVMVTFLFSSWLGFGDISNDHQFMVIVKVRIPMF